jgi:hypothetical protein
MLGQMELVAPALAAAVAMSRGLETPPPSPGLEVNRLSGSLSVALPRSPLVRSGAEPPRSPRSPAPAEVSEAVQHALDDSVAGVAALEGQLAAALGAAAQASKELEALEISTRRELDSERESSRAEIAALRAELLQARTGLEEGAVAEAEIAALRAELLQARTDLEELEEAAVAAARAAATRATEAQVCRDRGSLMISARSTYDGGHFSAAARGDGRFGALGAAGGGAAGVGRRGDARAAPAAGGGAGCGGCGGGGAGRGRES